MGAWGTAIFSDDTACDVRDEWRGYVGEGLSEREATDRLLAEWSASLDDPDEGPVVWLALAATQWKAGRLEERVKRKALAIIDEQSNLAPWQENASLLKKRAAALAKLREQLRSAPPAAKKIRKVVKATCAWEPGDVIAYRLRSGAFVLFRVLDRVTDKGGTYPYCQFYDWTGDAIPTAAKIRRLSVRPGVAMICGATMRGYPADRLTPTGVNLPPEAPPSVFGVGVWTWKLVDGRLEENWGYR